MVCQRSGEKAADWLIETWLWRDVKRIIKFLPRRIDCTLTQAFIGVIVTALFSKMLRVNKLVDGCNSQHFNWPHFWILWYRNHHNVAVMINYHTYDNVNFRIISFFSICSVWNRQLLRLTGYCKNKLIITDRIGDDNFFCKTFCSHWEGEPELLNLNCSSLKGKQKTEIVIQWGIVMADNRGMNAVGCITTLAGTLRSWLRFFICIVFCSSRILKSKFSSLILELSFLYLCLTRSHKAGLWWCLTRSGCGKKIFIRLFERNWLFFSFFSLWFDVFVLPAIIIEDKLSFEQNQGSFFYNLELLSTA